MATHLLNDTELWQLVQQDDRTAYEVLYRRYMRVLYAAIYKWTDNKADAEDLLQEVFLDIWEKRGRITIRHKVFTYLYSTTRFKVFDYLKDKQLSEKLLKTWETLPEDAVLNTAFAHEQQENADNLLSAEIAQLPAQMKQVYLLRFREGKSIGEIADELLVSPYTIKNHLQKIRKRLQAAITRLATLLLSSLLLLIGG